MVLEETQNTATAGYGPWGRSYVECDVRPYIGQDFTCDSCCSNHVVYHTRTSAPPFEGSVVYSCLACGHNFVIPTTEALAEAATARSLQVLLRSNSGVPHVVHPHDIIRKRLLADTRIPCDKRSGLERSMLNSFAQGMVSVLPRSADLDKFLAKAQARIDMGEFRYGPLSSRIIKGYSREALKRVELYAHGNLEGLVDAYNLLLIEQFYPDGNDPTMPYPELWDVAAQAVAHTYQGDTMRVVREILQVHCAVRTTATRLMACLCLVHEWLTPSVYGATFRAEDDSLHAVSAFYVNS